MTWVSELDVFEVPVLVGAALVRPSTQLCTAVLALTLYVHHFVVVVPVHDLVAVDAPELLSITKLELIRVQTVACNTEHEVHYRQRQSATKSTRKMWPWPFAFDPQNRTVHPRLKMTKVWRKPINGYWRYRGNNGLGRTHARTYKTWAIASGGGGLKQRTISKLTNKGVRSTWTGLSNESLTHNK